MTLGCVRFCSVGCSLVYQSKLTWHARWIVLHINAIYSVCPSGKQPTDNFRKEGRGAPLQKTLKAIRQTF